MSSEREIEKMLKAEETIKDTCRLSDSCKAQPTPHGGQDWRSIPNFSDDFSVTTNALGTPKKSLAIAWNALDTIHHYPPADSEPAWTSLAQFLSGPVPTSTGPVPTSTDPAPTPSLNNGLGVSSPSTVPLNLRPSVLPDVVRDVKERLVLGNGASEVIELCVRLSPGNSWRTGKFTTQYKEYERSAANCGKTMKDWNDKTAELLCMVNPCNPTGEFMHLAEMKLYLESTCADNSTVIIDESMIVWYGEDWRGVSLVSAAEWVKRLAEERNVNVYIVHSWTKLWSCPGLRIGSVLAPTAGLAESLRRVQVPWSLNSPAICFLDAAVRDHQYLQRTWTVTPDWRRQTIDAVFKLHPTWEFHGSSFLSFIWVNTGDEETAKLCVHRCLLSGVPIRWGGSGYAQPAFIRLAVRRPESVEILISALDFKRDLQTPTAAAPCSIMTPN